MMMHGKRELVDEQLNSLQDDQDLTQLTERSEASRYRLLNVCRQNHIRIDENSQGSDRCNRETGTPSIDHAMVGI